MKKAIILLAVGFSLAYCNPTQQADQTTTNSSRMSDSTSSSSSSTMPSTDTMGSMSDTTNRTDSMPH